MKELTSHLSAESGLFAKNMANIEDNVKNIAKIKVQVKNAAKNDWGDHQTGLIV